MNNVQGVKEHIQRDLPENWYIGKDYSTLASCRQPWMHGYRHSRRRD
jgi:hypothetical protein